MEQPNEDAVNKWLAEDSHVKDFNGSRVGRALKAMVQEDELAK